MSPAALPQHLGRLSIWCTDLTQPTGTQGAGPPFSTLNFGEARRQLFTNIGLDLGARFSSKTKAKIWANEYIDFGVLLSVAPPRERYALSMTSSGGVSGQPHLTLEAYHVPKKVTFSSQFIRRKLLATPQNYGRWKSDA